MKLNLNDKTRKILNILSKVFTWVVVAITVAVMAFTIFATSTFDKNNRNLFGFKFYIVKSDSMSKSDKNANDKVHFNAGDIIIAKNVKNKKSLKIGDVISFQSLNEDSFGETITHMIYDYVYDIEGNLIGYKTYGTNTGTVDESVVQPEYVMGKYVGKLSKLGYVFKFLKTTPGYIICILIPFMILIIYQGVNCVVLFKKYRKQQMAEINEEKAKIEEERKASADMLKELQELKAQLAQKNAENTAQQNAFVQTNSNPSQLVETPAQSNVNETVVEENNSTNENKTSSNLVENVVNKPKVEEKVDTENKEETLTETIDRAIYEYAQKMESNSQNEDKTEN